MMVIGSIATPKKMRVYHRTNCIYAKRILPQNHISMNVKQAEKHHYQECKYCAGLAGEVRTKNEKIKEWQNKYQMEIVYQKETDTLYMRTEVGFWKIFKKWGEGKYVLHHLNVYKSDMSFFEASHGDYHRQSDVKGYEEIDEIIKYIADHDRAKVIIMDDYRKLPTSTKKQKKYYRQAKNRDRRQSYKRMHELFAMIENEHPEYKYQMM